MSSVAVGSALGLVAAGGLWLTGAGLLRSRRPTLAERVLPALHDLPQSPRMVTQRPTGGTPWRTARLVFSPALAGLAHGVDSMLGGRDSVRRRLERLGRPADGAGIDAFRLQQVISGLGAFAVVLAFGALMSIRNGVAPVPLILGCGLAFVVGMLGRDQALSAGVRRREERQLAEFPTIADLLALSVAAGEGPVGALERVAAVSHGELSRDLQRLLGRVRTGTPVSTALDELAAVTGVSVVARFAEGVAVAIERGTPLVEVLHAQAADVREAGRRALIESGARKEVAMMVPVVFLILPVTVLFAFYPGVIGLHLIAP